MLFGGLPVAALYCAEDSVFVSFVVSMEENE
jgi:hypothetical protein